MHKTGKATSGTGGNRRGRRWRWCHIFAGFGTGPRSQRTLHLAEGVLDDPQCLVVGDDLLGFLVGHVGDDAEKSVAPVRPQLSCTSTRLSGSDVELEFTRWRANEERSQ